MLITAGAVFAGAGAPGHGHEKQAEEHGYTFGRPGKAEDVVRTIHVEARDIAFDPRSVEVAPGETVRIVIRNTGKLEHEFVLGDGHEQEGHAEEMMKMGSGGMHMHDNAVTVPAGETREVVWSFPSGPATLQYACHVLGHYAAGMVGEIKVR